MAAVHDVSSPAGLKKFNTHLEDKSYVDGYVPSQADFDLVAEFKEAPNAKTYVFAHRWYLHISSFSQEEKESTLAAVAAAASAVAAAVEKKEEEEEDDDFDVFGDEDEEDAEREAEIQRIADEAKAAKLAKGKIVIEKSVIVLDVKPWDSETDLNVLEEKIRGIEMEGLEWKSSERKPVAFGLFKIRIMCHVVDKLVSVDDLQDKIAEFEDEVQSTDIVSFSKL
mmetsp:Transcript_41594/g.57997  ORF Transcript_41594/g.57997 Transcript_41594/m.57997 type:complete len:224 (+) Transcript_41594:88-759(+)|eukprot:CAMPEP_0201474868 /NCGR_PEP_ID=MMETSP0151_2-20130828/327_1 /ASSEMBLY_ACC=CAM_ASM_000257 /TAXON_ID=200890 /ORGANISM="Paramoeba atlantica, Strain 621/1 / CCAP 1560/9" /LENGTH=223 /DNA_ID=CAMNT_0047854783 /DNA_START=85 /DNA_END=756 /DNA_ORIENTATION=-